MKRLTANLQAAPADQKGLTDRAVNEAENRLAKNPADRGAGKSLVAALLQKVRENADPGIYVRIDETLRTLGGVRSTDPEVLVLAAPLLLARHEFADALSVGKRALVMLPGNSSVYGILVDAYNELGRYDEALVATQQMIDSRPGLAAFARVSYARELRGDVAGALQAMQQAVIAGQGVGENAAYVQTLLGNLFLSNGDTRNAAKSYADALVAFPGFGAARSGQAAVLAACGKPLDAATAIGAVIDQQPVLQYAIAQVDYFLAAGKAKEAEIARQLVDAIAALQRAGGVDIDLEMAVYEANRRPTASLLERTRRVVASRPSVTGRDALAWVLHRSGKHAEAQKEMAPVLSLGDRDPVYRFHAAAIAFATNNLSDARANLAIVLAGNPSAAGINPRELEELRRKLADTAPRETRTKGK